FDVMPTLRQRIDEMGDGRAGADTDHHAGLDEAHRGAPGEALLIFLAHVRVPGAESKLGILPYARDEDAPCFSSARIACQCARVNGNTDRRLPRCRSVQSSRRGCARISSSVIVRASLRRNATSTSIQRGCSSLLRGSWYSLVGSNWVGSGYASLATSAMPTTPGWAQLEW